MLPGTYVFHNARQRPCFVVHVEDIDMLIALLRVRGVTAVVHPKGNDLAEIEFPSQTPSRVSLLLEELRDHSGCVPGM